MTEKPRTVGELIAAIGSGYTEPEEDRLRREMDNLQNALNAKIAWDAAREQAIDSLTRQQLLGVETGQPVEPEWSAWATPTEWQRAWSCSDRTYRKLRKALESDRAADFTRKGGIGKCAFRSLRCTS